MKNTLVLLITGILIAMLIISCAGGSQGGHAPGYGKTSECTICGKSATHRTSNYGFCDKHWKDAIGG